MVTVQGTDHKKFTFLFEKIKLFLFIWLRVRQSEDHLNKTWCDSSPKQSDHCNQLFSFSFCYVLDFSDNIKPKGQQTGYFTRAYCLILFSCVIFTGSLCSLASFKANKKWEILGEAALVFLLVMALMCLCPHLQTEAVVVSLSMSERAHQLWLSSLVHSPRKQNSSWCFPGFDDFSLVPLAWSYWQHTLCFLLSRFSVILLSSTHRRLFMLLEFSSQKNVQDGFDRFDIPGMIFKGRIKRMLLTQSIVGSFRNQENPNGKKQVIHRFPQWAHDAQTSLWMGRGSLLVLVAFLFAIMRSCKMFGEKKLL